MKCIYDTDSKVEKTNINNSLNHLKKYNFKNIIKSKDKSKSSKQNETRKHGTI